MPENLNHYKATLPDGSEFSIWAKDEVSAAQTFTASVGLYGLTLDDIKVEVLTDTIKESGVPDEF